MSSLTHFTSQTNPTVIKELTADLHTTSLVFASDFYISISLLHYCYMIYIPHTHTEIYTYIYK